MTPGVRPFDILLDKRHSNDFEIPELQHSGNFIQQPHSPIKEYILKNTEEPKIPAYRAISVATSRKNTFDYSTKVQGTDNETNP